MNGIKKFGGRKKKPVACDTGETGRAAGLGERGERLSHKYLWAGRAKGGRRIPGGMEELLRPGPEGVRHKAAGIIGRDITEITHARGGSCQAPAAGFSREIKGNR